MITGLLVAYLYGYEKEALMFEPGFRLIGAGMWIALVMAFNVWLIIWPNQKRALGIVEADDASKAKSARAAMLASRINTCCRCRCCTQCPPTSRWGLSLKGVHTHRRVPERRRGGIKNIQPIRAGSFSERPESASILRLERPIRD